MANVTHRAGATARVVLLVLLLIALCFGFLLLIPRPRQKQGPRIAGLNALAHLGLEIARWRVEHGVELPETLEEFGSSVVQGFGATTNLCVASASVRERRTGLGVGSAAAMDRSTAHETARVFDDRSGPAPISTVRLAAPPSRTASAPRGPLGRGD